MAGVSVKPATQEETEAFIQQNKRWLPDDAEQILRGMSAIDQRRVISAGTMSSVRDPGAVIQARVRKAKDMEVQINRGQGAGDSVPTAGSEGATDGRSPKPATREDVEAFIKANERWLQGEAEDILRNMNASDQKRVLAAGTLSGCRDPVAVIQTRAKKAREMEAEIEGLTKQAPPPPPPEPPPPTAPTFCEAAAAMHMFAPAEIVSRVASKFAPPPSVEIKDDSVPMVGEERGVGGVVEVLKPKYGCGKGQRLKVIGETGNLLQFEGGRTAPKNHENTGWKWILREEEDLRLAAARADQDADESNTKGVKKRSRKKNKLKSSSSSSSLSSGSSSSSSSKAKKKRKKTHVDKAAKTTLQSAEKLKVPKSSSSSSSSSGESVVKEQEPKNGLSKKTSLVDGALGIAQRLLLEAQQKVAREATVANAITTPPQVLPLPAPQDSIAAKTNKSSSSSSSSGSSDTAKTKKLVFEPSTMGTSNGTRDADAPPVAVPIPSATEAAKEESLEKKAEDENSSSSSSSSSGEAPREAKPGQEVERKEDTNEQKAKKEALEKNGKNGKLDQAKVLLLESEKDVTHDKVTAVIPDRNTKGTLRKGASSESRSKKDSKMAGSKGEKKKTAHSSSSSSDDRSSGRKRAREEKAKQKRKMKIKDRKGRERSRSKDKRKEKARSGGRKKGSKMKAKRDSSSTTSSSERRKKSKSRRMKEKEKTKKAKRKSSSSSSASESSGS